MKKKCTSLSLVVHTFGLGGAEQFFTQLAEHYLIQKLQIVVWTNHGPWIEQLKQKQIPVRKIPIALDLIGDWKGFVKALLLFPLVVVTDGWVVWQTRNTDAIVLSGFSQKPTVSWWAALLRRPLVWVEFGPLDSVLHKFFSIPKLLYVLAQHIPKYVIVSSRNTHNHLVRNPAIAQNKLIYIPCAVKMSEALLPSAKKQNNVVVCVSRLEPGKGQDRLIVAFKHVVQRIPTAQLRIVGGGGFSAVLNRSIKKYKLEKNITLLGRVPNALVEMKNSSLCVLPSTWALEGFGLTVVEAMMLGKPVIAFDKPPLNELIEAEKTGILVADNAANEEELLAEAIIRLLKDKRLRDSLGNRAYQRAVQHYSFNSIGDAYLGVVEKAIAKHNEQ